MLWNGERAGGDSLALLFFSLLSADAHTGEKALVAEPDQWHVPSLNLQSEPLYRRDISEYDELWLFAKTDTAGAAFSIALGKHPHTSASASLGAFLTSGTLNGEYQLAKIPLTHFRIPEYDASSVETLYFAPTAEFIGAKLFVDDIYLVRTRSIKILRAEPLSERVLHIVVDGRYDISAAGDTSKFSLISVGDLDWSASRHPTSVGRQFTVTGFKKDSGALYGNPSAPFVSRELFLVFDRTMKNGGTYTLTVQNIRDASGVDFTFPKAMPVSFDDTAVITGSVKVNQVGYLPDSPKYAYLGNYLGDAGAMPLEPKICEVRNAQNGTVVHMVTTRLRGHDPLLSGETVYECDFSLLTTPGEYYVRVPGLGRSYDFKIGANVFDDVYRKLSRLYYYQRASTDLLARHAGIWARTAGHADTDARAEIHPSQTFSVLGAGAEKGTTVDMSRGWYDAGDYGKYVLTAAPTLFELFTAYELFPQKFGDNKNNIPESGNGVPDLLDETKWEMDWLRNMQAPDGGVYDRVVTTRWGDALPKDDRQTRFVAEKTTHATAVYSAALAQASRTFTPFFPDYARDLLARSRTAWEFLEAHPGTVPERGFVRPEGIGGGDYIDSDGDTDSRAWAAGELYKTTGEERYHDAFKKFWSLHAPTYGDVTFAHFQKEASFAYATTIFPTDKTLVGRYKKALKEDADALVRRTETNLYRGGYHGNTPLWIGWGNYSQSAKYAWELIKARFILGDETYVQSAQLNLDPELGANPLNVSFITGIGDAPPENPLHTVSTLDGVAEPVPGIPVYGVHTALTQDNPFYKAATASENLYPAGKTVSDPYPALRRYYDTNELVPMSEFSIADAAPVLAAFAYFSSDDFEFLSGADVAVSQHNQPSPHSGDDAIPSKPTALPQIIPKAEAAVSPSIVAKVWSVLYSLAQIIKGLLGWK